MRWPKSIILYTDGASRGNPGPASIGVSFVNEDGEEFDSLSEYIGEQTNNFAEYTAVLKGLQKAHEMGVTQIHLKSDSQFLIKQLQGEYAVKSENIKELYKETMKVLVNFKSVKLEHVPREQNKRADKLANLALDLM